MGIQYDFGGKTYKTLKAIYEAGRQEGEKGTKARVELSDRLAAIADELAKLIADKVPCECEAEDYVCRRHRALDKYKALQGKKGKDYRLGDHAPSVDRHGDIQ